MSEFVFGPDEMLRPIGDVYEDLRDRASEVLGRIGTRMGFGETAITYSTESSEPDSESSDDNATAEMANEEEDDDNGDSGDNSGSTESGGHDPSTCTATVCSSCGKGGGGKYFSAVPRKGK